MSYFLIAAHDFINTEVFPAFIYRLGQSETLKVRNTDVDYCRTGNLFQDGMNALSYKYRFKSPKFDAIFRAVWKDEDQATASVTLLAISPDTEEAKSAMITWMSRDEDEEAAGTGLR